MPVGLKEPEFIDGDIDLRINIYRGHRNEDNEDINTDIADTNADIKEASVPKGTSEKQMLAILKENPSITQSKIAERIGLTDRSVRRILAALQADGIVTREGTNRSGKWIVKADNK